MPGQKDGKIAEEFDRFLSFKGVEKTSGVRPGARPFL